MEAWLLVGRDSVPAQFELGGHGVPPHRNCWTMLCRNSRPCWANRPPWETKQSLWGQQLRFENVPPHQGHCSPFRRAFGLSASVWNFLWSW